MDSAFFRIIKSSKFQLLAILALIGYILFIYARQYNSNIILEQVPEFMQLDGKNKKLTIPVTVGIHINSFPEFSFDKNNFVIDAIIWFKFIKSTQSLDTIGNFSIKNSKLLGDGSLIYKTPPIIKILDKDVLVCYHIQANFMSNVNFRKFPISDHRLNIILQNKSTTAQELVFITDPKNVTFSENILVENWVADKVTTTAGYYKADLSLGEQGNHITYPCVAFSIDFNSIGARLPISLYLPLFILFFIILISLILNISDTNRLGLVSAGVPALVLFRLVIDAVSPDVGYSTHIDIMYYLIVALSLAILFIQIYFVLMVQRDEQLSVDAKRVSRLKLDNMNALVFFSVILIFIAVLTYNYLG